MSAAYDFEKAPPATSWKLLSRTVGGVKAKAEVRPGFVPDTYILIVSGKKPCLNMTVRLAPATYVRQPEYWEIQVTGSVPGICLTAIGDYHETLPLDGVRGAKGVVVKWADDSQTFDI
ncbi:MAG: hypothetical protein AB7F41_12395 [Methylocystis sp.]|uniref:hypothetical protein n=1 Tax=Methylocystis sp. TaxID=1911079 RepID=UPI003D0B72CC